MLLSYKWDWMGWVGSLCGASLRASLRDANKSWGHGGCNAFDTTAWYRSYYTIVSTSPKRRRFKNHTS